ncbi:Gfo/Idh/MocA family oxidoreductase [Neolewinella aurantiaca]|uniref:Gfo/Idh/MocA family oxidoreductase n=1 Tax=Neolewinella aurantiaca TaxID=2602767 RepID=A0A5C7FDM4_9BACT|nr:Gfo/Idh/MocA family oxidoreductase [Neolewinella aurantiaca]TXF88318.1 Gfo/Idh/MocA family oxidoreductase [Neolewinella aurantiaca]
MYSSITAGVAGTGFIGPVHVEGLRRLGVRVKGISSATLELAEEARQQLNLEHAYPNFEAMLEDDDLDVIHLAVPNVLHYPMVKQVLAAGKHVMCEKPLAMTSEQGKELVELAAATNLKAGVNYNLRFYPMNLEVKDRLASNDARIFSVVGGYQQDWLLYDTDYNWRVLADQGGALRAVSDIGTHWLDLVHFTTGLEVEAVLADLTTVHTTRRRPKGEVSSFNNEKLRDEDLESIPVTTDDCASILLKFKGGAKGQLFVTQVSAGHKNRLTYDIATQDAAYEFNSERPNELLVGRRDAPSEFLLKDPALLTGLASPYVNYPGGHNEGFPDTFKQCFRSFYNDILAGDAPTGEPPHYATFEDGLRELVICDAIIKSHEEQAWVYL